MTGELILVVAGVAGSGGAGIVLGFHLRGFIPLRAPSNRVRLDNAKTDAQIEAERTKGELESARARAEIERIELETGYTRAVAAVETSRVEGLADAFGDDADVLIRARRTELGWSQKELGRRTRLRPVRISLLENGASPTMDELKVLAAELDLQLVPARLARAQQPYFARQLPAAVLDTTAEEAE